MIFSTVNKIPAFVLEKLDILFQLLKERKKEYETFACKINDKHLKRTVLTLAQETNQYANELSSQIETMGGNIKEQDIINNNRSVSTDNGTMISDEDEILKSCEISETKMIIAYRTVLNEPFLHDNLRKLIRCQLNGLTYAFMQLRLLNTSLHTSFHR
ncbi:MAG: DUF2383 domain-containing protein [Bacteroidota bacterium]